MKKKYFFAAVGFGCLLMACQSEVETQRPDWLIDNSSYKAGFSQDGSDVIISNGLICRRFKTKPNVATVSFKQMATGQEFIRAVRPEAELTMTIDGHRETLAIGGLNGQPVQNYLLPEWLDKLTACDSCHFKMSAWSIGPISQRMEWKKRTEWLTEDAEWPPKGIELGLILETPTNSPYEGVRVSVFYEFYDGLPLLCKWVTVENNSGKPLTINSFKSEILAAVEGSSNVETSTEWVLPNMFVETDYAFIKSMMKGSENHTVHWLRDTTYTTQVSYLLNTPCQLEVYPAEGPEQTIADGDTFATFRTWELLFDSSDRERKELSKRRMYRVIAPWSQENPVLMHVRNADEKSVKLAVDQCAEVGFEMVIMTFGSGFNMEDDSPENYAKAKALVDYAHSKDVALGGYSLLASRRIDDANDVINHATGKPGGFAVFGNSPCLGSEWGEKYFQKLYDIYEKTGMDILEHDGSYPGDFCASEHHPGHKGYLDSQWSQWRTITDFYKWCRARGIYLNVPDWYFLTGSTKYAMGYRETNWSLPRAQQEIIERQNIYDGTWDKTPSMGWMFVPLTQYHGGGAAATIEPLSEHLDHYDRRLANLFGAGVQACYRGPRLYDTDSTKAVVKRWVDFYKKYRPILNSDIIHLRRADGRDWDGILHVNPSLQQKGLLMVYNPLNEAIEREITVPLYYTGLTDKALVKEQDAKSKTYRLARDYSIKLKINIPANGYNWFVIE